LLNNALWDGSPMKGYINEQLHPTVVLTFGRFCFRQYIFNS